MARQKKAPGGGKPGQRRPKSKKPRFREQAKCRFCREKVKEVDYKNVAVLTKLTTHQGKIHSSKRSGNCASHQRSAKTAIKRARFLALMPYVG